MYESFYVCKVEIFFNFLKLALVMFFMNVKHMLIVSFVLCSRVCVKLD